MDASDHMSVALEPCFLPLMREDVGKDAVELLDDC